jgi:hypothetical protein
MEETHFCIKKYKKVLTDSIKRNIMKSQQRNSNPSKGIKEVKIMKYDYREAMREDVKNALEEIDTTGKTEDEIYDELFIDDSVTGNASGSYTFNSFKAREYVTGNEDLLVEALEEFGAGDGEYKKALTDAEYADVTIRCYLLYEVLTDVLEEIEL